MSIATILIPTHDAADTVVDAVDSARRQTISDIEIMIVGDGVSPEYRNHIAELAKADRRIVFLDLPKAPNRGERNRHHGVLAASSDLIVYLADDDLLLPRHTGNMIQLLGDADLCQSRNGFIDENDRLVFYPTNLAEQWCIEWHLLDPPRNRVSITGTAHTVAAYRRLERGWETSPPGVWTDLHLWRQFFRLTDFRGRTHHELTTLQFPAVTRVGRDHKSFLNQRQQWVAILRDDRVDEIVQSFVDDAEKRQLVELSARLNDVELELSSAHHDLDALRVLLATEETRANLAESRLSAEETRARRAESRLTAESALTAAAEARASLAESRRRELLATLDIVTNSRSWKYTAPLRRLRSAFAHAWKGMP